MMQSRLTFRLVLNHLFFDVPNVIRKVMHKVDAEDELRKELRPIAENLGLTPEKVATLEKRLRNFNLETCVSKCERNGIRFLEIEDDHYPPLLRESHDAPPLLYMKGHGKAALTDPFLAVVGPRRPSTYGQQATKQLVSALLPHYRIVSGLAQGIDAIAHRIAIDAKQPTVAVLGTGLDTVYPTINQGLAEAMLETGVLLSEFPPGVPPLRHHFPQRNRLVAGMSQAVLLTEAGEKSGSLITARLALEENREVFCVPGPIFSDTSRGVNKLIQDGATLVQSADDIVAGLSQLWRQDVRQHTQADVSKSMGAEESAVWTLLGATPISLDEIITQSGLHVHQVMQVLSMFELNTWIEQLPGQKYVKR